MSFYIYRKPKYPFIIFLLGFVFLLFSYEMPVVKAQGPLLAERTVAQWGGIETRERCLGYASMSGMECRGLKCRRKTWKTCNEWAIDLKQHRIVARMYGPDNISNPDAQLRDIANSCLASGLVLAGVPAIAGAAVGVDTDVLRKGVETCLKTQNLLSQIVAPGFKVTTDTEEFW